MVSLLSLSRLNIATAVVRPKSRWVNYIIVVKYIIIEYVKRIEDEEMT